MRAVASFILLVAVACAPDQPSPASWRGAEQARASDDLQMEDVRILSADDMQGRMAGTPGGARARAYLLERLSGLGLAPLLPDGFTREFTFMRGAEQLTGANLLARIEGTGASDRTLVLMAHYDHVGVQDGEVYNGADDNASGVAAALAIAAALRADPPRHDVILALVDAEEDGLSGSRALVRDPAFARHLPAIVMAVNLDMIGRSDRNELFAAGGFHFPWLKPRLEAVAAIAPVRLRQGHDDRSMGAAQDWTTLSDHMAFHEVNIPWVYFGVEDHPDYHRPTDDFARMPEDFFRRSAATVELAVRAFNRDLDAIAKEAGR